VWYAQGKTWLYDGSNWTNSPTSTIPVVSSDAAMATDSIAGTVTMFGGYGNGDYRSETWDWNGADWTQRTSIGATPSKRGAFGFTEDPGSQRLLMFGGMNAEDGGDAEAFGDTWTWDGAEWKAVNSVELAPGPRVFSAMVFDKRRGRSVLFGGYYFQCLADTWQLDRFTWTGGVVNGSPPGRRYHSLAYDDARGVTVLFGGYCAGYFGDTWVWDGLTWTSLSPAASPPARADAVTVYDSRRERVVMFGGYDGSDNFADTWEWDGTTWHDVTPASGSPASRWGHTMAYDASRGVTVMYGGNVPGQLTWEWDGASWTSKTSTTAPRTDTYQGMFFDPLLRRVVLVQHDDIWMWDGVDWALRALQQQGPLRAYSSTTFDSIRRKGVRFGGTDFLGGFVTDTWGHEMSAPGNSAERCLLANEDFDGDGLAGCADPDCWGRCSPLCLPGEACPSTAPRCGDGTCSPVEDRALCPVDCS
jgi:hypothetical protein